MNTGFSSTFRKKVAAFETEPQGFLFIEPVYETPVHYTKLITNSNNPVNTGAEVAIIKTFPASSTFPAMALSPASIQTCVPNCAKYAIPITFNTTVK